MEFDPKEAQKAPVSEDDLRENFARYQDLVNELARRYPLPAEGVPVAPANRSTEYVFEPVFFYQVHARS